MLKKTFLFLTTLLTATSVSTGYGSTDSLKGNIQVEIFLDWFNNAEKYLHVKGLIILDLIPILFLIVQTVLFFKDGKKIKGIFAVLALSANIAGVFILIQNAQPIASQIAGWKPGHIPSNWTVLKDDWINYIGLHGLMSVAGWLCFVITFFVSERANQATKPLPRFLNFSKNAMSFFLLFILGMGAAGLYDFIFFPFSYKIAGITFIEMHRPLDLVMRKVGPIVFTVLTSIHVLLAILFFIEKSKHKGWLIIAGLLFLLCDTFIALQYNRPLNDLFLTWTPTTIPTNWSGIRDEWLNYHLVRTIFKTLGIIAILLIFFVPKNKTGEKNYVI